MRSFAVEMTASCVEAIAEQARYIAMVAQAPANAQRWLKKVLEAVDSLETWPCAASLAEEDAYVAYEVRQLVVGSHLLLFSVDQDQGRVWIIGLRHGHRLPRPGSLPDDIASLGRDSAGP